MVFLYFSLVYLRFLSFFLKKPELDYCNEYQSFISDLSLVQGMYEDYLVRFFFNLSLAYICLHLSLWGISMSYHELVCHRIIFIHFGFSVIGCVRLHIN